MSYNGGRAGYQQGDADRVRTGARGDRPAGPPGAGNGRSPFRSAWPALDLADGRINAAGHHAGQCRRHRASGPKRIRPGLEFPPLGNGTGTHREPARITGLELATGQEA